MHIQRSTAWILAVICFVGSMFASIYIGQKLRGNVNFPMDYSTEIEKWSAEYGVEAALVRSVIWAESRYRPAAVSSAGARGLMQIMPDTGAWLCQLIGEDLNIDNPADNIRMGTYYLKYLFERFYDSTVVLAAYNAGPTRVAGWLADPQYAGPNNTLLSIPFPETATYVNRVLGAYQVYASPRY